MTERGFCEGCPSRLVREPRTALQALEMMYGKRENPWRNRVGMARAIAGDQQVLEIYRADGVLQVVEEVRNCEQPKYPAILGLIGIRKCGAEL